MVFPSLVFARPANFRFSKRLLLVKGGLRMAKARGFAILKLYATCATDGERRDPVNGGSIGPSSAFIAPGTPVSRLVLVTSS